MLGALSNLFIHDWDWIFCSHTHDRKACVKRWEYRKRHDFEKVNELGKKGWRVISVFIHGKFQPTTYILERELREPLKPPMNEEKGSKE